MSGRVRRLLRMLMPWAPKAERVADIQAARGEADRSRTSAAHAKDITDQIRWLYEQNHWSATVAEALGINRKDNGAGK